MTVAPPVSPGTVQDTASSPSPGVTVGAAGAPGTVRGVAVTGPAGVPVPAALTAATRNSCAVPLTSPVTVAVVAGPTVSGNRVHAPDGRARNSTT